MEANLKQSIFRFAYDLALADATRQKAYVGSLDALRGNEKAVNRLEDYIEDVLAGRADDQSFWDTAKDIEASFAGHPQGRRPPFTFGNVQKLINMTAKYLFIACYANDALRANFAVCHCPMDNIMVAAAIRELEEISEKTLCPGEVKKLHRFLGRGNKTLLRRP